MLSLQHVLRQLGALHDHRWQMRGLLKCRARFLIAYISRVPANLREQALNPTAGSPPSPPRRSLANTFLDQEAKLMYAAVPGFFSECSNQPYPAVHGTKKCVRVNSRNSSSQSDALAPSPVLHQKQIDLYPWTLAFKALFPVPRTKVTSQYTPYPGCCDILLCYGVARVA